MTDSSAAQAEQDWQEAMEWAMIILGDPKIVPNPLALDSLGPHQAGFSAWVAGNPERVSRYVGIVQDMLKAGDDAARDGLRPRKPTPQTPRYRSRSPAVLAASLTLVLLAAAGIWWRSGHTSPSLIAQSEARTPIETRVGEVRTDRLEDGTSILLDTDTLLLVTMTATQRRVELKRGRARFTVAQDAGRPFMVRGAGADVTTRSGSFDITAREGLRINPIDTIVDVVFSGALPPGQARSRALGPGQLLARQAGQGANISVISAPRSEQQWVTGVKSFDNVPISDVIAEANSYSETKIELVPPTLGRREIFADIDIRDIERVAQAIRAFLDADIDRSQPGKLILAAKK